MKGLRLLKGAAVSLACLGLILPRADVLAAGPQNDTQAQPASQSTEIVDVAMTAGGTVTGQVLDEQGQPLDGAVVSIRQGDEEVAQTVSDARGTFTASNLRGGVYSVAAGQGQRLFRFWAPNTAPPAAQQQAVVVSGSEVVRGQFGGMDFVTMTVLGTSIAAVTLSAVTLSEINDVEDDVDQIKASL